MTADQTLMEKNRKKFQDHISIITKDFFCGPQPSAH